MSPGLMLPGQFSLWWLASVEDGQNFESKNFMAEISWFKRNLSPKYVGSKEMWLKKSSPKNYQFRSKNNDFGYIRFWLKKYLTLPDSIKVKIKNFGYKNILSQKNVGPKKNLVQKKFVQKTNLVQSTFGQNWISFSWDIAGM